MLVLPAYPQYSGATTASVIDAVAEWSLQTRHVPEWRFINRYHDDPGYIQALATTVREHWAREGRGDRLVMSFHGMPERTPQARRPLPLRGASRPAVCWRRRWGSQRINGKSLSRAASAKPSGWSPTPNPRSSSWRAVA